MLCKNKVPVAGRFVASVTREIAGGEVKMYPILETGGGAEMTESQKSPLIERAIPAPKKRKQTKKAKHMPSAPVDITPRTTHSKPQPSADERTEPDSPQEQNSVPSGEAGRQEIDAKPGPFRTKTEEKDSYKRRADSTEIPQRKYYRPTADAKTYRMNGQGQLQCQQDSSDVTRVGSAKELPLCREKPIFHEPEGALITDKEQLTSMYLNSFDRVGRRICDQDRP